MRTYLLFSLFVIVVSCTASFRAGASEPLATGSNATTTESRVNDAPPVDDWLQAAEYLEAAGNTEQARRTRIAARNAGEKARLSIGEMQPADMRQILIRSQILEISRTKLRVLGFDMGRTVEEVDASGKKLARVESSSIGSFLKLRDGSPAPTKTVRNFIDSLVSDQLAKVLSEPQLVVTTGRPATIRMGREVPTRTILRNGERTIEMSSLGTEVRCTAVVLDNGSIHLDYEHTVHDLGANDLDDLGIPQYIRCTEFDTEMVLQSGQTGTASQSYTRLDSSRRANNKVQVDKNEIEVLLLVTAELVEAKQAAIADPTLKK